jgi:hypothetical protein
MDGRREGRETDEDGAAERDMDWELEAARLLARWPAGVCGVGDSRSLAPASGGTTMER